MFKKIYNLGDKLEDKVRSKLSHYPIVYAFIGGTGIIIFWRGVWHTMDYLMELTSSVNGYVISTTDLLLPWWDGPLSVVIGTILLLISGLFVTSFIGNEIIISGLRREKKVVEKTEEEIQEEAREHSQVNQEIRDMDERLREIKEILKNK